MYDDDRHARLRLCDSLVLTKRGTPILVNDVINGKVVYSIGPELSRRGSCDLSKVNVSPPPLGYLNLYRGCTFLSRVPKRRDWRQGLRPNNVKTGSGDSATFSMINSYYRQKYPSFQEALLKGSCAFSRVFAVDGSALMYKGGLVGNIINGEPRLLPEYEFLSGLLEESL